MTNDGRDRTLVLWTHQNQKLKDIVSSHKLCGCITQGFGPHCRRSNTYVDNKFMMCSTHSNNIKMVIKFICFTSFKWGASLSEANCPRLQKLFHSKSLDSDSAQSYHAKRYLREPMMTSALFNLVLGFQFLKKYQRSRELVASKHFRD